MNRRRVFYLRIAAILLIMLLMLPVSVALNYEVDSVLEDESSGTGFASKSDETEQMEQEIGLSFNFLKPMLQMTEASVATVDSIMGVLETNPENLNEMETALISLNESMAQLNASLEYPDVMTEAANSTLEEPDSITTVIADMFKV